MSVGKFKPLYAQINNKSIIIPRNKTNTANQLHGFTWFLFRHANCSWLIIHSNPHLTN